MYEENVLDNMGKINISEEVISVVAGVASSEVKGVAGMCNPIGGLSDFFGKKNYSKGVKVVIEENEVKISVSVSVNHGCNIPNVAAEVQEKVKREVETMTGLNVTAVDVYVSSVVLPKEEKGKDSQDK